VERRSEGYGEFANQLAIVSGGHGYEGENADDVVERVAKWNFDRRAKQVKDQGGAAGWWDEMPEDVKESHRNWATELLAIAALKGQPT
jgi:hypothetical protein